VSPTADPPVVEVRTEAGHGHVTELRVRSDGRFEVRQRPHGWDLIARYTPDELVELREEMQRADDPPLPARVEAHGVAVDPVRQTWRLQLADGLREVVIEQYSERAVPRLARLHRKLFTIPRAPVRESLWRVRVDGAVVRRTVVGELAYIPALERMLAALYERPDALLRIHRGTAPKRLLVDIRYFVDGAGDDRLAITPGGRAFLTRDGKSSELRAFTRTELAALRRAIDRTNWPRLPEPITKRS